MADITLKAYLAHVDDLLGRRQYEEAEAHCKHILAKYPKNLAALQQLAKAQLEAGQYVEAENTYTQVLALEPRSIEAYVGLSWVTRQRGQGDPTIALLERAYEQDTNNQDVVQLLRDAHRTFNDRTNAKLPQTPYVAARQQWRSGLDQQAVATLNAALVADPTRVDVRLLKAHILMQMGNGVEAARTVNEVLKQLPDCVEANRILAEFWKAQGRSSDAQRFVNHVEAADPFLAFEIATGGPPPAELLILNLLDYRASSDVAAAASSTPDWLGELGMQEQSAPEQAAYSTPQSGLPEELGWVDPGAVDESEPTDRSWLQEAGGGSALPDDLSWLTEAASEEDLQLDEQDDFADFASAFNDIPQDDASMPPLNIDWMESDAADEDDTMPSVSTRMAEEELENVDNLRELSQMGAEDAVPQPEEEDWMSAIESASNDPTLPERQNFDEFLKNFTSFGELESEAEPLSGTSLTGSTWDEQANPDVADIDPEDPLAWMREATMRGEIELEMPELDTLLGDDLLEQTADSPPLGSRRDRSVEPNDKKDSDSYVIPSVPNADDPFAWMHDEGIEMVDESRGPSLWDDPLGVENMTTIDQAEVDPLAWMKQAGIAPGDDAQPTQAVDGDDLALEDDPFAWARESGLDLDDEAKPVNIVPTSTFPGDMFQMSADDDEALPPGDRPATDQPPTNASGLLAFIHDGDTTHRGDGPMNDQDLPDWLSDPNDENEPAKSEDAPDLSDFDWMAVAPAEADAEIDWDAAPDAEAVTDEAPPDWLASLENPADAAGAAELSAQDDPNVAHLWESAADDSADSEMPDWMATLRDEPAADEAVSDVADWVFSEGEAATDEAAAAQEDLLASASQAHDATSEAAGDIPAAEDEAMDWLTAAAPAEAVRRDRSADEDMDWLNDAISSDEEASTPEAAEIAENSAALGIDWLAAAATAEVLRDDEAVQDAAVTNDEMDWLNAATAGEATGGEDSEFDWMADVVKASAPETAAAGMDEFDFVEAEAGTGEELAAAEADFLTELNDSSIPAPQDEANEPAFELSFIEEDMPTEDVATVELEGDPLPDWMVEMKPENQPLKMDVDVSEDQLEMAGNLAGEILDDADLLEAEPPMQETLTAAAVNSPDWLNAMVPGLEVGTDLPEDEEDSGEAEFMNGGRSDFGWLTEIVDEELAPPAMAAPSRRLSRFPFSEPPLWLAMLRDETQASSPVLEADNEDENLPDWLKFDDAEAN